MEIQRIIDTTNATRNSMFQAKKRNNFQEENKHKTELFNLENERKTEIERILNNLKKQHMNMFDSEDLLGLSIHYGEQFAKSIKTNQIRNFFAAILSIKNKVDASTEKFDFDKIKTDFILLKPKIAYAAGRKNEVKPFKEFIDELVDALMQSDNSTDKATKNFFTIIESVVAYHKFYGGKDN